MPDLYYSLFADLFNLLRSCKSYTLFLYQPYHRCPCPGSSPAKTTYLPSLLSQFTSLPPGLGCSPWRYSQSTTVALLLRISETQEFLSKERSNVPDESIALYQRKTEHSWPAQQSAKGQPAVDALPANKGIRATSPLDLGFPSCLPIHHDLPSLNTLHPQ